MMWAEKTKTLVNGKLLGSEPQSSGIEDPAICFLHSDEPDSRSFNYQSLGCEDLKTINLGS